MKKSETVPETYMKKSAPVPETYKSKGRISINRRVSATATTIHLEIEDDVSGIRILDLGMTPEAFGNALTGLSYIPCELEVHTSALANPGMVTITKSVIVEIPESLRYAQGTPELERKLLGPYEVLGWKARRGDLFNLHKYVDLKNGIGYRVTFFKFVTPEEAEEYKAKKGGS